MLELQAPLDEQSVERLRVGQRVCVSGRIFTARDQTYKKALREGLPEVGSNVVFHAGPVVRKRRKGWEVVAIGPTTSSRLGSLEVEFVARFGVKGIIGKGGLADESLEALRGKVIYLAAPSCSALFASRVRRVVASYWLELGLPEALWVLEVEKLGPLVVGLDVRGNSLYEHPSES